MAAYWRRPERYLDPEVRANISGLALLSPDEAEAGDAPTRRRPCSRARGTSAMATCSTLDELDAGYRLVVAGD